MGAERETGKKFKRGERLGRGSYGSVYRCEDERGHSFAVKCCQTDAGGLPNVLEASIMSSISHPNLARARLVSCNSRMLYIVQDLAVSDLSRKTRKDRGGVPPSPETLRRWGRSITAGLAALHAQGILHGDVKASNVLYMPDDGVRLADFTLSVRKRTEKQKFRHTACTVTHRPLECILGEEWDERLDIWSLGCTLFEVAFGTLLFPYQKRDRKEEEGPAPLRQRAANCIVDWSCRFLSLKREDLPPVAPSSFFPANSSPLLSGNEICPLLSRLLEPRKERRPHLSAVLDDPYWKGEKPSGFCWVTPLRRLPVPVAERNRVERYLTRFAPDPDVRRLATELYSAAVDEEEVGEQIKAAACALVSCKVLLGYAPNLPIPFHQLLPAERMVCSRAEFRLHTPFRGE